MSKTQHHQKNQKKKKLKRVWAFLLFCMWSRDDQTREMSHFEFILSAKISPPIFEMRAFSN